MSFQLLATRHLLSAPRPCSPRLPRLFSSNISFKKHLCQVAWRSLQPVCHSAPSQPNNKHPNQPLNFQPTTLLS